MGSLAYERSSEKWHGGLRACSPSENAKKKLAILNDSIAIIRNNIKEKIPHYQLESATNELLELELSLKTILGNMIE